MIHHTSRYTVEEPYRADRGQTIYDQRMIGRAKTLEMDQRLAEHLRLRIVTHRDPRRRCLSHEK